MRLASAEPEQLPWNGIHINGVPPSQPPKEQLSNLSKKSPETRGPGQRPSMIGSHANETDEGYFTYSQPDHRSSYSGESYQMRAEPLPGQSSVPRNIPSTRGQARSTTPGSNMLCESINYQLTATPEQQSTSKSHQEPHSCAESGCAETFKTLSDLK